jgi:endonuclease III
MEKFHFLLIMVTSQMMQDETLHEQYLRLVNGRVSLGQMIAPFQRVSFFSYYKHFCECYEKYSTNNKKAESLMTLMYTMSDHWSGEMLEKRRYLLALPQVA